MLRARLRFEIGVAKAIGASCELMNPHSTVKVYRWLGLKTWAARPKRPAQTPKYKD